MTMLRILPKAVPALVASAAMVIGGAGAVGADPSTGTTPTTGWVRFGHFAPGTGAVDLYVDGQVAAAKLTFKHVSTYMSLPSGPHDFQLRPADMPSAAPLLEVKSGVAAGAAETVSAVTTLSGLAGKVYDDQLAAPPAGQARVRFIHAAPAAAPVNISVVGGATLASGASYPNATSYQAIAAGTYNVQATDTSTGSVVLDVAGWKVDAGTEASVVIIQGADGKLDVVPVLDAGGSSVVPLGGLRTGLGGTAPNGVRPHSTSHRAVEGALAAAAALLLAGLAGGQLRRRRLAALSCARA